MIKTVMLLIVIFSLLVSLAEANNKASAESQDTLDNQLDSTQGISLEDARNQKEARLEELSQDLVTLRIRASLLADKTTAKDIEKIENELNIEKTKTLLQSVSSSKNKPKESDEQSIKNAESTLLRLSNLEYQYTEYINQYQSLLLIAKPSSIDISNYEANTELLVSSNEYDQIQINTPMDVNVPSNGKVVKFCAPLTGSYKISTSYYGGSSSSGIVDTALWVYQDSELTNQLAFNDDVDASSYFSKITLFMDGSSCYYIKVRSAGDWIGRSILTRLTVELENPNVIKNLSVNGSIDVSTSTGEYFKFTPRESGYYTVFTGFYGRGTQSNDTMLYLYDNANLSDSNLIAYNDDVVTGDELHSFSAVTYSMIAGQTYYVVLKGYEASAVYARITLIMGGRDLYEFNDDISTAYPIVFDHIYKALLSRSDWEETAGESDHFVIDSQVDGYAYFSLKIPEGQLYNIDIYEKKQSAVQLLYLSNKSNVIETSFKTKKGYQYVVSIQQSDSNLDPIAFYTFRLTQNQKYSYTYTTSGRIKTQSYERGLYKYTINFNFDNNGNLKSKIITKSEILQ